MRPTSCANKWRAISWPLPCIASRVSNNAAREMVLLKAIDRLALQTLLDRYGLELRLVAPDEIIPGSYWGEREAGLIDSTLYARLDTPVHSVLHEGANSICMPPERRAGLDTDAGGDDAEENAVCYLQIILAKALPQVGAARMCSDMDE